VIVYVDTSLGSASPRPLAQAGVLIRVRQKRTVFAGTLFQLLEARICAQRREIWAGIERGKIAPALRRRRDDGTVRALRLLQSRGERHDRSCAFCWALSSQLEQDFEPGLPRRH
jgi:hypothetical protein